MLKIAVFGTSRSGKDVAIETTMDLLQNRGTPSIHISPIAELGKITDGRSLNSMDESQKRQAVEIMREDLSQRKFDGVMLFDEHYCFPEGYGGRILRSGYFGEKLPFNTVEGIDGRRYEVIFQDDWLEMYDVVVYMETDPEVIVERFADSNGYKYNPYITEEDVRLWQLFEIEKIQRICASFGTPLFYLYGESGYKREIETVISHCSKRFNKTQIIDNSENHTGARSDGKEPL